MRNDAPLGDKIHFRALPVVASFLSSQVNKPLAELNFVANGDPHMQ